MAEKVIKAAASAVRNRKGPQQIYFPNRIIQFMSNQEKKVCNFFLDFFRELRWILCAFMCTEMRVRLPLFKFESHRRNWTLSSSV